jgi:hypothetical protein
MEQHPSDAQQQGFHPCSPRKRKWSQSAAPTHEDEDQLAKVHQDESYGKLNTCAMHLKQNCSNTMLSVTLFLQHSKMVT